MDIKCVQGTDGGGMYGSDTFDEQLALQNLLELSDDEFAKMREVEDEITTKNNIYFSKKVKKFDKFLSGRTMKRSNT